MITDQAGAPIIITCETKMRIPFGVLEYFDPDTVKITITDPIGAVKVIAADMTKRAAGVGQYSYICVTAENWAKGSYTAQIDLVSGAISYSKTGQVFVLT